MTQTDTSPLLIFADDGAPASDRAWRWISSHPWPGWSVDVMTADESQIEWGAPITPQPWTPPWERDRNSIDAETVSFLTAGADPRAMLAETTADLIVLGMKPARHLAAVMTGSTTEWLLHHPPSPLAIVKRSDPVSKVLVCADGSPHSLRAIETFAALPLAGTTNVTVLSVDDGRVDPSSAGDAAGALESAVASVTTSTASGRPTDAILALATDLSPDLIVLGTRGLTGWSRLRLGSTASAVVRSTSSDSLVACVNG
ncbi:MAG: universal stress protein [Acidimicrobiia bacterium]